jgi:hypothetical protein
VTKEREAASAGEYRVEGAWGTLEILHADAFRPKKESGEEYSVIGTL